MKGVFLDLGGVLIADHWPVTAAIWGTRLGVSAPRFLAAVFEGNDDQVLVGRMTEPAWWELVRERLPSTEDAIAELRRDLARREIWDRDLVSLLRRIRGTARTAVVSNAWPEMRARIAAAGRTDLVDEWVMSCDVGAAKPDARIFQVALRRVGLAPGDVLFVDDTAAHVEAAISLGLRGHVHRSAASTVIAIEGFLRAPR